MISDILVQVQEHLDKGTPISIKIRMSDSVIDAVAQITPLQFEYIKVGGLLEYQKRKVQ